MHDTDLIDQLAARLLRAEDECEALAALSDAHPTLDEATGYAVQDRALERRLERGEHLVGVKLGLTSKAKQQRMHVETPIVGWLTNAHRITQEQLQAADGCLPAGRFIHPRVEPEIFVTLAQDLSGEDVTVEQVRGAVGQVHAGLDVIDSRFLDFRFTLSDVVSDNASGAGFVFGTVGRPVDAMDLELEAVVVEVDGKVVDTATGAAILGHPLEAVAAGVRLLARRGHCVKAGQVVLAGAMTDAIAVEAGRSISFHFTTLGSIHVRGGTQGKGDA